MRSHAGLVTAGESAHEHRLHLVQEGRDAAGIDCVDVEVAGANLVELGPREEEADGAEETRHRRHEHRRDAEFVGEPAGMDWPRAAVGDDREVAWIAPLLRRDRPQRPGHARIRNPVDAVGRLEHREPERAGHALHGSLGERRVDRDLAVGHLSRRHEAEHDVGIGDRRLDAPPAVARGAGRSAGALRADLEAACRVEPGNAAPAGSDLGDVDRRDPQELARATDQPATGRDRAADLVLAPTGDRAVLDQ